MPHKEVPSNDLKHLNTVGEGEDASIDFADPITLNADPASLEGFSLETASIPAKKRVSKQLAHDEGVDEKGEEFEPRIKHRHTLKHGLYNIPHGIPKPIDLPVRPISSPERLTSLINNYIFNAYKAARAAIEEGASEGIQKKSRTTLARLITKASEEIDQLPEQTAAQRKTKDKLRSEIKPYLQLDTNFRSEDPLFDSLKSLQEEAQKKFSTVQKHRSAETIQEFERAVVALRQEFNHLVKSAPRSMNALEDTRENRRILALTDLSHEVELTPEERLGEKRNYSKEALTGAKLLRETAKARQKSTKPFDTAIRVLERFSQEKEEAPKTPIEQAIGNLERALTDEKETLRISEGKAELHGVKPDYTADEIAHLKGIQAYLREKPANEVLDRALSTEKHSTKTSPHRLESVAEREQTKAQNAHKLKTHHELMWDSYNTQKAELDEEKTTLEGRLGAWINQPPAKIGLWTKIGDTLAGFFDRTYVSTEKLLSAYTAKKEKLEAMHLFLLKPDSIIDQERDVRILSVQADEALALLMNRGSLADDKQKAIDKVREIQEKLRQGSLSSPSSGSVTLAPALKSLQKNLSRAEGVIQEYQKSLAQIHTEVIQQALELSQDETDSKAVHDELRDTRARVREVAQREWEATAPYPLLRRFRDTQTRLEQLEKGARKPLLEALQIARRQTEGIRPEKLPTLLKQQPSYATLDSASQQLVLEHLVFDRRIDALREAREKEYVLKHHPLLQQTKRGQAKQMVEIKELYAFAYDAENELTPSKKQQAA